MSKVLPGRPTVVRRLKDMGVETLLDAIERGYKGLHLVRGLGFCTLQEIEIAALRRGYSIYTDDIAAIKLVWRLVKKYGMANRHYRPGYPISFRGELTPRLAHLFAIIIITEGGVIKI